MALRIGASLLEQAAKRAKDRDARQLTEVVSSLRWMADQAADFYEYPLSDEVVALVAQYPDLSFASRYANEMPVWVNRERARIFQLVRAVSAVDVADSGQAWDVCGC